MRMRSLRLVVPLIIGGVACSPNIDQRPLDESELTLLWSRAEKIVQPFRLGSNCRFTVVSLGRDIWGESCGGTVSELNSVGTAQGLSFYVIRNVDLSDSRVDSNSSTNVDLIYEIDPADGR
jgi:hypothetical protein